jgi:addiction module RelE/StbE family toxin
MRVVWTRSAKRRLRAIHDFLVQESAKAADAVVVRLVERSRQLEELAYSGRKVTEFERDDIRELLVRPYRIIYAIRAERIDVLTVVHYRQLLPSDLPDTHSVHEDAWAG